MGYIQDFERELQDLLQRGDEQTVIKFVKEKGGLDGPKKDLFAMALRPQSPGVRLNLGDAYRLGGDMDKARLAYKTYLALSPAGSEADRVRKL